MPPSILADVILVFHVAFVAVVILSVPLIMLGGVLNWQWVRSPFYRFTHLGMIVFVACESVIGMICPLTSLENLLRAQAGERGYDNKDFIASWLDRLLFYNFPPWVFSAAYLTFAAVVAFLFYFVPVRKKSSADDMRQED